MLVYEKTSPSEELISSAKVCKAIKTFAIKNVYSKMSMHEIIDEFPLIEHIKIHYEKFNDNFLKNNHLIFSKPKCYLKKLFLRKIELSENNFKLISLLCPQLESICFEDYKFKSEESMKDFFLNTKKLKHLRIITNTLVDPFIYNFLSDVPATILKNIIWFQIRINAKRAKELVSILKKHCTKSFVFLIFLIVSKFTPFMALQVFLVVSFRGKYFDTLTNRIFPNDLLFYFLLFFSALFKYL